MADHAGGEQHGRFDGMAVEHVLGSLEEGDAQLFRAHLLDCSHCRARVGELRAIAHDLDDVERAAQRQQAAEQLETKKLEAPEREQPSAPPRRPASMAGRVAVMALLGLLLALVAWNFVLRGQVAELEAMLEVGEGGAAELWDAEFADGVSGEVRADDDALQISLTGLGDEEHRIEARDGDGELVAGQRADPADGALFVLLPAGAGSVARVEVAGDDVVLEAEPAP